MLQTTKLIVNDLKYNLGTRKNIRTQVATVLNTHLQTEPARMGYKNVMISYKLADTLVAKYPPKN